MRFECKRGDYELDVEPLARMSRLRWLHIRGPKVGRYLHLLNGHPELKPGLDRDIEVPPGDQSRLPERWR